MSTTTAEPAASRTGPWRRHRATVVIVGAAVAAVLVALLVGDRPATSEPLDPDNPGADGARAVARVLGNQGVDVHVVRGAEALDRTELGPSTTVLVTSTSKRVACRTVPIRRGARRRPRSGTLRT